MYPQSLLSKPEYKYIQFEEIHLKGFILIRRPKEGEILFDPDTGQINAAAVCEYNFEDGKFEIFGLSLNLYGVFQLEDLRFILLNPSYKEYWKENDKEISVDDLKFKIVDIDPEAIIMIFVDDCIPSYFEYKYPERFKHKNLEEWDKVKGNPSTADEFKNRILKGHSKLEHKPLKGNFWHFEKNYYEEDGTLIPNKKKLFSIDIANNEMETWVKQKAKPFTNVDYKIEPSIYKKQ